jgi:hypothetical protein
MTLFLSISFPFAIQAVPAARLDATLRNIALTIDIALPSVLRFLKASFSRRIGE